VDFTCNPPSEVSPNTVQLNYERVHTLSVNAD